MGNTRPWRWTEEEFYAKLDDYLEQRIYWMSNHLEEVSTSPTTRRQIKSYIRGYNQTMYPPDKRAQGCKTLAMNVRDWSAISSDPNTSLETLMLLYMAGEIYSEPLICVSYMCKNPKITEEFVEDAMFVGSGLFWFNEWDRIDIVIDYIDNHDSFSFSKQNKELLSVYDEARIPVHVKDRIDWEYLNLRNFSPEFIKKHRLLIERSYKHETIVE